MKALGILSVSPKIFLLMLIAFGYTWILPVPVGWAPEESSHADVVAAVSAEKHPSGGTHIKTVLRVEVPFLKFKHIECI